MINETANEKLEKISSIIESAGFNIGGPLEQAEKHNEHLSERAVRMFLDLTISYLREIGRVIGGGQESGENVIDELG